MTKLLEHAIEQVRDLPDKDQDAVAAALLSIAADHMPIASIDYETRQALDEGMSYVRRGEFVPESRIAEIWKRYGV